MAIDNTTTSLVASIKRRGFIPAGSGLSTADILAYASDELQNYIPAFLKSIREEFIVASLDLSVTSGTVAAPARAVGAALRTIGWVQADGRTRFLTRVEPENAGGFAGQTGEPAGYMFQGNNVILLPTPSSGTLRITYQQRPGVLVLPEDCGLITAFDAGAGEATLDPVHSEWTTDMEFDVVSGSANFQALGLDVQAAQADQNPFQFGDVPVGTRVGDYVCLAGETCIPQLPTEVHALLAQSAALAIANATGSARLAAIQKKFDDTEKHLTMILSPRSDGSARPIVSNSRIGRWNMGW